MRLRNPFKRKTDPRIEEVYESRRKAIENKKAMADKIIEMVDHISVERRCGVMEGYAGQERRQVDA